MKNATYEVSDGKFLVNGEAVAVSSRVLRIALASASLPAGISTRIPTWLAERILELERAYSVSQLTIELVRSGRAA